MDQVPSTFDWVEAHFECSSQGAFLRLMEVVDSDVKSITRHHILTPNVASPKFDLSKVSAEKFIVIKTSEPGTPNPHGVSVVFELTNQGIAVKRGGPQEQRLFLAKPILTTAGECKLRLDGEREPLEFWQVSQKALEDLFFGSR